MASTDTDFDPFAGPAINKTVPTTEPQREMWAAMRFSQEVTLAYNESVTLTLLGSLEVQRLSTAVNQVVARHETLRATLSGDGLSLLISEPSTVTLKVIDLSDLDSDMQRASFDDLVHHDTSTPFDLARGPLYRFKLAKLSATEHRLVFTAHHIVCDGWSTGVVLRELKELYNHEALPPAESFATYALQQRERAQKAEHRNDEQYWTQQCKNGAHALDLPTDRSRPPLKTFRSKRFDVSLDSTLVAALKKAGAKSGGASLFATMLSGFMALVHRLSGEADVIVGIPTAGQSAVEADRLVGHAVNTLPIRAQIDPREPFSQFLTRVKTTMLDGFDHQQFSFGELLKGLAIVRDPSRLPLVSVLFNLDRGLGADALGFAGIKARVETNPRQYENFDLFLNCTELDGELHLECQYNSDLFLTSTVQRWLACYTLLLQGIAADSATEILRLPLVSDQDRALFARWNATSKPYDRKRLVHEWVEQQARATPDSIAVSAIDGNLSYRELDQQATQLARHLRTHEAKPKTLVGLYLARSKDLLVAMLAVLKTGAAYVPLDPAFPDERIAFMCEDSHLQLVVSQQALAERLPQTIHSKVILERDSATIRGLDSSPMSESERLVGASAQDLVCYVIYTSGSTGMPKGVLVPHGAVVNFLGSMHESPGIRATDTLVAVTTLSFDIAVLELWGPLTVGARVVLSTREVLADGAKLAELMLRERATIMQATPATWRLLLAAGWKGDSRLVCLVGGEAVPHDLAVTLAKTTKAAFNMYGPTETTVWSTIWPINPESSRVSIGKPIANTTLHVLDELGNEVPVGVAGELWIGGDGVTKGYHERPELNVERFAHGRYRTGDLVRFTHSGDLEYIGRNDFQVKLRGYRIELGEIEVALSKLPDSAGIKQAVCMVREDIPGDARLVAYVVSDANWDDERIDSVRAQLRKTLPDYMVPQHFVALHALPLTPNAKVDRKALPVPAALTRQHQHIAASTPTEKLIAELFADALKIPTPSVDEDFFRLGGHSLLAAQLVGKLSSKLGRTLELRKLFEHPSIAALARYVDESVGTAKTRKPILRRTDMGPAPVSPMQQRLWFVERLDPLLCVYNLPASYRIKGDVTHAQLQQAMQLLVNRHEALRTTIVEKDNVALQVVHATFQVQLEQIDWSHKSAALIDRDLMPTLLEWSEKSIDLGKLPLFHSKLVRLNADEQLLFFMPHHAVWDGWSFDIFLRDFSELLGAVRGNREPQLPELSIGYADFSVWHREWMKGEELERPKKYWLQSLAGSLPTLDFPTDKARPANASYRGATEWVAFSSDEIQALTRFAHDHNSTLFMVMLSAFEATLHYFTGQEDILIGTPVRGRSWSETEDVIGFFVNTLVLRADLSGNPSFAELLGRTKGNVLNAFSNGDMPFELLVQALNVHRDLSRTPLYQAFFSYQDATARRADFGGVPFEQVHILPPAAATDISLWVMERKAGLVGGLNYNSDLFDRDSMQRFIRQLRLTVLRFLGNPQLSLQSGCILPDADQRQLVLWGHREGGNPPHAYVHEWVAQQASLRGAHPAVVGVDATLTYEALNQRANQLAHALRKRGVGGSSRVGLYLHRQSDLLIAMLAVVKSGAAYVPLDPNFPSDRIAYMCEDAELALVICHQDLRDTLPKVTGTPLVVLCLDSDVAEWAGLPTTDPEITGEPAASTPMYVIYTSGSTGRPKGVVVGHGAVANFIHSMHAEPGMRNTEVVAAVTTLSFDIAVLELWATLCAGATIALATRDISTDGSKLATFLSQHRVTLMQATPATWRLLFASRWSGDARLTALVGGEALPKDLAQQLSEKVGALFNMYGPTETTVWSTLWKVPHGATQVCIGHPIANTTVEVLDREARPAPLGAIGELVISGKGVALGYWKRPELTAEKFIPNPHQPGTTRYRTGDLVRFRSDGELEYVGRNDFQVKVRGFRIELGEIESALTSAAPVREVVCVAREDIVGDARLVAYVALHESNADNTQHAHVEDQLREHVRPKLPEYMHPQHYVFLNRFPLTPNGKIDRKALPAPSETTRPVVMVAPSTATEQILHDLWCEALSREVLSIHDNFFALGGHSLLAAQIVGRLAERHNLSLELRKVFETPTVHGLASWLDTSGSKSPTPTRIPKRQSDGPAPLSLMQQRLWFVEQLAPNPTVHNLPLALRFQGAIDDTLLARALQQVVDRHEPLRTHIGWNDKQGSAFVHTEVELALERVDCSDHADREAFLKAELATRCNHPFDLAKAPIARACWFKLSPQESVLFFMTHHIVWDGWSYDLFANELSELYAAAAQHRAAKLSALPIAYTDFASWHRDWLQGPELERQRAHWLSKLQGPLPVLELPGDRSRPPQMSYDGGNVVFVWPKTLSESLTKVAQRSGGTLYMALLAGLAATLGRYTQQQDLLIGTPVRGRSWPETENIIGFFANTLVLRLALNPEASFDDLVSQTRDVVLDAFDHGDMPFEQLVEALKVPRDMSRTPLYQVMFSFQDARQRAQKIGDIAVNSIELLPDAAATDLTIWLVATDEGIRGDLNYNTDVFSAEFAQRFVRTMQTLLQSASIEPEHKVGDLNLISSEDRALLTQWNHVPVPFARDAYVMDALRQNLSTWANDIAVVGTDRTLTYADLFTNATRLARHLRSLGAAPGKRIGIFLERTTELLVAVLGILESGAAYVPLDPSYPRDRVAFMIEDAALPLIVTQSSLLDQLPAHQANLVMLDTDRAAIGSQGDAPLKSSEVFAGVSPPSTNAYVIYTSGSTGKPKGVLVPHSTVVNFLNSTERAPGMSKQDVVMALATLSFDIAVVELLLPLYVGARIVMGDKDLSSDGDRLKKRLTDDGITFLQATPATWRILFAADWRSPNMKVISTGEAMPKDVAEQMLQRAGEVWNGYGPTETTVWSTVWKVQEPLERVLIGRPLDNTQIHVLDARLKEAPIGVYGEVYIGGDGVTLGYLNRPDLSAERFVADPFGGGPRMYKTGDIARYRHDGQIDYQGRNDHQVKVRGFRIELGEIEATLASHPTLAQATVIVREDRPGDVRIVAYVVTQPDASFTDTDLRKHLKKTLPDYMVPQNFMRLDALPLTPNGKVDRKALPAPFAAVRAAEDTFAAPRTETEKWLASVWIDALRVNQVGLRDNFFDLGGHSLLSLEVIAAIEKRTGNRLNPRLLLLSSLEQVAAAIDKPGPAKTEPPKESKGFLGKLKKLIS